MAVIQYRLLKFYTFWSENRMPSYNYMQTLFETAHFISCFKLSFLYSKIKSLMDSYGLIKTGLQKKRSAEKN